MIEIIFEDKEQQGFFIDALEEINVPIRLNDISQFEIDLNQPPDNILFFNNISPSCHIRGNDKAVLKAEQYLEYLAAFNRRVINDIRTLNYEMSKVEQYRLLKRHGLAYPPTVFSSEISELITAARQLAFPVLVKHNRSSGGYGIKQCDSLAELTQYLYSSDLIPSPDGILMVQEFIESNNDSITRLEIIDGDLVYAYRESIHGDVIYFPEFTHPMVAKYFEIVKNTGYDIINIEFIESSGGSLYTFDINGTLSHQAEIENQSNHLAKRTFQKFTRKLMGFN